jgi:hypothetical protein
MSLTVLKESDVNPGSDKLQVTKSPKCKKVRPVREKL